MANRKAKVYVQAVEVCCPLCQQSLPEPLSGSLLWELAVVRATAAVMCGTCGKLFELPKNVHSWG